MDLQDFQDVTKITFKKHDSVSHAWKRWFSVSDPANLRRLLSALHLKPFESDRRPGCIHDRLVSFQKDSAAFDVDFCEACFGGCHMPREFYNEFQRLARRHIRRVALLWFVLVVAALAILLAQMR